MSTMTLAKIQAIRPGWRIRVNHPLFGTEEGVVAMHFNEQLHYTPDAPGSLHSDQYQTLNYLQILNGQILVEVIDASEGLEIEEVDGPPGGRTVLDRIPEIADLTHDDPVQSGPINTHVAHPTDGYDEPEKIERILAEIYLPMSTTTIVALLEAITEEFPKAVLGEGADDTIMRIVES